MEQEKVQRSALKSLYIMNTFLLITHVSLLTFFSFFGIKIMAFFNIASVLTYASGYLTLRAGKITPYIFSTYIEILVHMLLAVICMGWDCGFQLYYIGSIAIVFYADYYSVRLGERHIQGVLLSVGSLICYFTNFAIMRVMAPVYDLDKGFAFIVQAVNAFVVFSFCIVFFLMLSHSAIYNEEELSRQANYDKLTGLANRRHFLDYLERVYEDKKLAKEWVAIMDIDDFKKVNDVYGHNCGDYVLQTIAGIISRYSGSFKTCRWGGEEFLVQGSCTEEGKPDYRVLESIRREVEQHEFVYEELNLRLTITIGVAKYEEGLTIDQWVDLADKKLYIGKKSGKNRLVA